MDKENIKIAFSRVKEDILFLGNEITNLKYELAEIKAILIALQEEFNKEKPNNLAKNFVFNLPTDRQTNQQIYPTHTDRQTDKPTVPQEVRGLKGPNTALSTGNEGVPTDRQTDRQTNQQTQIQEENIEQNLKKAQEILNSLDYLKKEIRQKFKKLTPQEMTIFSSIYQLSEEDPDNANYKQIAKNLKLSESSIRDYVLRIISKGIPIKKQKIDNKKVILSVSNELKKIATLSTIIQLREL